MWRFNRFRCLLFRKEDAFRWMVTLALTISVFAVRLEHENTWIARTWNTDPYVSASQLWVSQVLQTYVKYEEYYVYIPKVGIRIKPFQLWAQRYIDLFRTSNWLLVLGVVLLLVVHLEEILVSLYV